MFNKYDFFKFIYVLTLVYNCMFKVYLQIYKLFILRKLHLQTIEIVGVTTVQHCLPVGTRFSIISHSSVVLS